MRAEDLDYELPERLIAQYPPDERDGGRLLEVAESGLRHRRVRDLAECIPKGALVVLNDTRVMPARLFGVRAGSGGKVQLLVLSSGPERRFTALAKAKRPLLVGDVVRVGSSEVRVEGRSELGQLEFRADMELAVLLEREGHVPLPPYVRRDDEPADRERYQTVFARHSGSSAAPTAGLHLSTGLLSALTEKGVEIGTLTLHVGLGTFRPVASPTLEEHVMHRERYAVTRELVQQVGQARERGAPVVAVGTTVVRALESAALAGELQPSEGETELLIQPGFEFRVVDALLTNFHAPRSTLLALVYAFAGRVRVQEAYRRAVEHEYRFLSYGDAMWLPKRQSTGS